MSKTIKNFLQQPSFFIILFVAGVFVAALVLQPYRILSYGVLLAGVIISLLLVGLKKTAMPLILLILGMSYFWFFSSSLHNITAGCREVSITSNPESDGITSKFAVKDLSGARAFVAVKSDLNLQYSDKVGLCFKEYNVISSDPSYARYLKARYLTDEYIKDPEIEFLTSGKSPLRYLYAFSASVSKTLGSVFIGDTGALAKGLILGGSQGFSHSFVESLRNSGTTHLVAVSGYNVSIITIILFQIIRQALSRRAAVITTISVLLIFCLLTGATASVLRASLMGFLYILSKTIGRRGAAANSLFVAAFLMVLINPFSIWDVGFELSFAATLGLVVLEGPLRIIFSRFINVPEGILTSVSSTLAAQLFTLPILLFSFGQVSLLAPVANVLILPFVPLTMLMVAITYIALKTIPVLGVFVAGLSQVLLDYIIAVIKFFGGFSFSALTIEGLNWIWLVLLILIVYLLAAALKKFSKRIILTKDEYTP